LAGQPTYLADVALKERSWSLKQGWQAMHYKIE